MTTWLLAAGEVARNVGGTVFRFAIRQPFAVVALAAVVGAGYWHHEAETARAEVRTVALERENALAAADSTREVLRDFQTGFRFWQRRAFQETLRADSLDRMLELRPVVRVGGTVVPDPVDTATTSDPVTTDSLDTRTATFEAETPVAQVWARVWLPPAPEPGRARFRLTPRAIPLELHLGCRPAPNGVRSAFATLRTPAWARAELQSVHQSPEVCNPNISAPPTPRSPLWGGLAAAAGGGTAYLVGGAPRDVAVGAVLGWGLERLHAALFSSR